MGAVVPHRGASAVCPRRAGPSREGVSFQTQAGAAHVTGVQRLHREERGLCCREGPRREAERAAQSTPLIREGRGAGSEALIPKGVWLLPRRSSGKFKVLGPIPPLRGGGASSKHRRHFQLPFAEGCSSERTSHSLPLTRISAS